MSAAAWEAEFDLRDGRGGAAIARPGRGVGIRPGVGAGVDGAGGRLRLTLRGRTLVSILAAVVVSVVALLVFAATSVAQPTRKVITVHPGETLSQIAARELPEQPIRAGVIDLVVANGLQSDQVSAGQTLTIPNT
ncbi:MAG: LysM peptidoglycan-binding domain-containing protein [Nostocoides sp.]